MKSLLLLAFVILIPAVAAAQGSTIFPPADCSTDELRVIAWQQGSASTVCLSGQEFISLTLPECKDGDQLVFRVDQEFSRNPVSVSNVTGQFVCEPAPGALVLPRCDAGEVLTSDGTSLICTNGSSRTVDRPATTPTTRGSALATLSGTITTSNCSGSLAGGTSYLCTNGWYSDIKFDQPFDAAPTVTVSGQNYAKAPCSGGASDAQYAWAENITKTGFRLFAYGSPVGHAAAPCGGANEGFANPAQAGWTAIGMR